MSLNDAPIQCQTGEAAIASEPVTAWRFSLLCLKCGHRWTVVSVSRPDRCAKCKRPRFWETR